MQSIKKNDYELLTEAYAMGVRYGVIKPKEPTPKPSLSIKAPPNELVGKWLEPLTHSLVVYAGKGQLSNMLHDIDLLIQATQNIREQIRSSEAQKRYEDFGASLKKDFEHIK